MQSKHTSITSLLLVVSLHAGVLAAVVMAPTEPKPIDVVMPTIQGAIVMVAPVEPPPPPREPPPSPEPKPVPKPKPLPKAPPSERAVKAPAPPPPPPPPVEKPAEPQQPADPQPAPVLPPNADASELNNPAPGYPDMSRRLGEKGTVTLEIQVKADGSVGEVKIKESSGFKRLDQAAINAIKRWRFVPASQAGIAIDYWYEIPFEFGIRPKK